MLTYRQGLSADIDKIVTLVDSAYRGDSSRAGWTTEADFIDGQRTERQEIIEILERSASTILLCEDDGQLVATVQLNKSADKAYLGMFAVDPQRQATGLGIKLLNQAENFVQKEWNSGSMRMLVISIRKELISWYQRHGYNKTGSTKPFPYGETRFGIPKRDDLVLEILEKRFI